MASPSGRYCAAEPHLGLGAHPRPIGTAVVRALESAADSTGVVRPRAGWTNLVVTPERGARAVDGLLTGWHEPASSHLLMLEAIAERHLLEQSCTASLAGRYRWHELSDVHLILP